MRRLGTTNLHSPFFESLLDHARPPLLIAILFLGLCLASPLLAQSEPPSAETVQQSLDKLAERKLAEADQKVAKASLEQTLKFLAARGEALQSLEDLKKRLSDAPRQIEETSANWSA